jgi:hypothetical protein
MVGFLGGGFAQGMMDERERLAGERLRISQAFDQFRRNNPYATLQEFQSFADQVSGGDSYLRGRFPTEDVMSRMAQDNAQRKALDDAGRQAEVLDRELRVDRSLQDAFRQRVLSSGDVTRSMEETLAAFGRDPASREVLRSRLTSSVGDPAGFLQRVQFEEAERVMPNVLNALRQGIDITPFVQGLPDSIRTQVQTRARDIVQRERAESGRAAQQADAARRLQFMNMVLPQVTALMGDANNTETAQRFISESAAALGLSLSEGDVGRIVGMARAGRDASLTQAYGNAVNAGRELGATRAGEEITTYQGVFGRAGERAFTNQNDQRRTVIQDLGTRNFLTPDQQTAAIEWLKQNGSAIADPNTMARQLREHLARSGPVPTLNDYRARVAGELAGSAALPPVQFSPWRDQTRTSLNQIRDAARQRIEESVTRGDRQQAAIALRRAEEDLARLEGDIARRQAQPGWFQTSAGPVNMGQVAELAASAAAIRQQLRALLPPEPQAPAEPAAPTPPPAPGVMDRISEAASGAAASISEAASGAAGAVRNQFDWQSRLPPQPPPPPPAPPAPPAPSSFDQSRRPAPTSGPPRIEPPTDEEVLERAREIRPDFDRLHNPSITRRRVLEEARQELTNERVRALSAPR